MTIQCWTNQNRVKSGFIRSASDELLSEVGLTRLVTACNRAFVNVDPILWNRVPYSVRACESGETFQTNFKAYLFKKCFIK